MELTNELSELISKQKLLKSWSYIWHPVERGYNNRTLYINVGDFNIKEKEVTQLMKDKFIGGKGFGLKLLWDATKPDTKWDDPENEVIISPGPVGGISQYSGAGKSLLVSISPQTDSIMDSNVGGYFGPFMKFAGFDALELQGKADQDVIIYIDGVNHKIEIYDDPGFSSDSHLLADELTLQFAKDSKEAKNIGVVSTGAAAEHSLIGMVNFSFWDNKRKAARLKQAGRGGIGTVMRNKRIKAIVAKIPDMQSNLNNVADLDSILERGKKYAKTMKDYDDKQNQMRRKGTANIVNVMADYDLLPTHNFKFGSHMDAFKIHSDLLRDKYFTQNVNDACWYGCAMMCSKGADNFELKTGPYKGDKVTVDGPEYETAAGLGSNMGIFDYDAIIEANFYCDTYGICTITWGTIVGFLMDCYENGIINKEITGGLELKFGNAEDALELLHQLARGEGFGKIAGLGVRKLKKLFVEKYGADEQFLNDIGMENKGLEYSQYVSKESLAQQGGYAMTNKGPQHDEAWLIFMDMVNNQIPTFEDKAEALHYFPMFRTWFGLMGLCKIVWNDITPPDNKFTAEPHKIPEHVDNYVTVFNGVTGLKIDKHELIRQSERVYNFQRIFNIRRGFGLRKHDAQPYRAAGPVTVEEYESRAEKYDQQLKDKLNIDANGKPTIEKVAIMRKFREDQYEKLLDAVYERRGWTKNGVPKVEHLKNIGMDLPELLEIVGPLQ
ncbi:MAG TPA: aldehyde ferredoxin oxidoreductase C-terminal domain-containing protein [Saprospiraceae bacterium]|nr:aldehyde ferredoxin oxidoreductase C-terminal domain-containing protein [Saprospiraceae bacterium]